LAVAAAATAIRLDEDMDEGHLALATIRMWVQWDFEAAHEEYLRALEINPGDAELLRFYGYYLRVVGRIDEAIEHLETAEELDPLSHNVLNSLANAYFVVGRLDDAKARYDRVLQIDAAYVGTLEAIGWWHLARGEPEVAYQAFEDLLRRAPARVSVVSALAYVNAISGKEQEARAGLNALLTWEQASGTLPHTEIARVLFGLGDLDAGFEHLNKAVAEREPSVLFLHSTIKPYGDAPEDPRWGELLDRLGVGRGR
jgi:Flp pilus assembly protein TadD